MCWLGWTDGGRNKQEGRWINGPWGAPPRADRQGRTRAERLNHTNQVMIPATRLVVPASYLNFHRQDRPNSPAATAIAQLGILASQDGDNRHSRRSRWLGYL